MRESNPSGRPLAALACALVVSLGLGCGRGQGAAGGPPPPPMVETLVVAPEDVRDAVELVGQLEAAESVTIRPEIAGVVDRIAFEEGKPVEAGQPLVYLRDAEQRARLQEAEAQRDLAGEVYKRTQALARRNAESAAEVDRARAQFEVAKARVELARVELARTVVRAPFDGVAGERLVSPGERVMSGGGDFFGAGEGAGGGQASGLVRIESMDPLELNFALPEAIIPVVRPDTRLQLRVASIPDRTFTGQVHFIAPRVNAATRALLVKARVPNPEGELKPGMFVKLEIELAALKDALMVPEDAVIFEQDGTAVWRLDDQGVATRARVVLGLRQGKRVEVREGLAPGDRIVASGTHKVAPGRPVRATAQGDPSPAVGS